MPHVLPHARCRGRISSARLASALNDIGDLPAAPGESVKMREEERSRHIHPDSVGVTLEPGGRGGLKLSYPIRRTGPTLMLRGQRGSCCSADRAVGGFDVWMRHERA